jgi:hypothetical protein
MKGVLTILLILNVCYGQKDSTNSKKDTSSKMELTLTTYDRNGNILRQHIDSVFAYPDTLFFIKPKID